MIVLNIKLYMRKKWLPFIFIVCCFACTGNKTEKHQDKRENLVDVSEKLTEIEFNDVLVNMIAKPYIIKNYLVITDPTSDDRLLHIFDKDSFRYIFSTVALGRGPGEIINLGNIAFNETDNQILVTDNTKLCVFAYNLDSLLLNPLHHPYIKARLDPKLIMNHYVYISDSLSIGELIEPTSNSTFRKYIARWNMKSGIIEKMPYEHPDIENKRVISTVSEKYGIYVECYNYNDLMTICTLNGELKYNVYGDKLEAKSSRKVLYYCSSVAFCGDKILALYSGENTEDDNGNFVYPDKFLEFDLNGEYIKTLETGRNIEYFCFDEENNRLIMTLDDKMQFAYLDLHGLL